MVPTEIETHFMLCYIQRVTRCRTWLRHCSTNRKIEGSMHSSLRNVEEYGRFCLLCGIPITYYVVVSVFSAVKLDREANRRKKIR